MKKITSILAVIVILVHCLSGCIAWDPVLRYSGEHGELMATAIHSIPGVESSADDSLIVLENDPFGRVLFAVCLTRSFLITDSWNNCVAAILIMQKYDDNYVYFYPEQNYHLVILENQTIINENVVNNLFTDDIICNLKEANFWNVAPSEKDERIISMPNACEKSDRLSSTSRNLIEQCIGTNIRCSIFRNDSNGNTVYFILHVTPSNYEWYIAAFKQDGTLFNGEESIMKLDNFDPSSMVTSVREFLAPIS